MLRLKQEKRRRSLPAIAAILTVMALLGSQMGVLARLQATLDAPSPATGHASVIAQGVAEMPVDPIAWRVVLDTAEPIETAAPIERALGFVVAEPDGVQVIDASIESQQRLATGEASFVPEASVQTRASLTAAATNYLRVALVSEEDAKDPGSDELVFGGTAFAAPTGLRDIDLVRDVLTLDENTTIAASDYPTLVITTGGAIEVTVDGERTRLADGEAAEFTGDLIITGFSETSSFVAGVIGPEVPVPPRTTGTVTLAVYQCAAGVSPSSLGSPIEDGATDNCGTVRNPVTVALTTPDGDALTLGEAESVRDGVYAWTALPFGDYTIDDATNLPSGASNPTFYDGNGYAFVNNDVSISDDSPDVRINLFIFSTGSGSITVTVFNCPSGWSPDDLDPNGCDPITSGFGLSLSNGNTGDSLTLNDASSAGDSFVWSGLGLSPDADTYSDGYYVIDEPSVPDGFNAYTVSGTSGDGLYVNLTGDSPNAAITVFNYITANPTGTITLDSIVCPSVDSSPDLCSREFGPAGISGVFIQDTEGIYGSLTEGNASQEGNGPYVWPNVPVSFYYMDTGSLVAPDGYEIFAVVLTPDGINVSGGFDISEDVPIANIVVLLAPIGGGGDESTPTPEDVNVDADGLTDEDETTFGTDSLNPDSDEECHLDGPEIEAGTDPLDAGSAPSGECDLVTGSE